MALPSPLVVLLAMVPVFASLLLGAQLRLEYLRDVVASPRALLVGLAGQYLLLPLLALAFFWLYPVPSAIGSAWFILAAAPGGAISNMITFLGRGRLSLSIVLTACSTLTGMVTIPLWVNVGLGLAGDAARESLPIVRMVLGSFVILVVPLTIGISVGLSRPALAARVRRHTRVAMLVLLIAGAGAYVAHRWAFIVEDFHLVTFLGAALFHVSAVAGAWCIGRAAGLDRTDRFTVGMEVGVQNVVIALLVAELLGRSDLVPFVGYYALATFVVLFAWVALLRGEAE